MNGGTDEALPATAGRETRDLLTERAYDRLKQCLMTGVFAPGQKITARACAAALGMSMTPAREAMARLVAERALGLSSGRTAVVPTLGERKLDEIYSVRLLLEGYAAESAAPRLSDNAIVRMENCQLEMLAARERMDFKTALQKNEEFHFTVYEASGLDTLVNIIGTLWVQIGPSFNLLHPQKQRIKTGVRHHAEAIAAARQRDARKLRLAIERDIAEGRRFLKERFDHEGSMTPEQ